MCTCIIVCICKSSTEYIHTYIHTYFHHTYTHEQQSYQAHLPQILPRLVFLLSKAAEGEGFIDSQECLQVDYLFQLTGKI